MTKETRRSSPKDILIPASIEQTISVKQGEKQIFEKAKSIVLQNPGTLFNYVLHLYAERKLFTFFWIHLFTSLIVYGMLKSTK